MVSLLGLVQWRENMAYKTIWPCSLSHNCIGVYQSYKQWPQQQVLFFLLLWWWAWLSPMLIGHPFLLFWHCLLSLTAPLWPPYHATYCANHATWHNVIDSACTQHYYRPLIILVIGLRRSTQAPCFTAPFMSPMTLLGIMCPGPGKLIKSQALSHHAINRPHDTSLFSHSPSPDQLPLLCTSFSFASYHTVYGAHATMSALTIAFVLISPVHTD